MREMRYTTIVLTVIAVTCISQAASAHQNAMMRIELPSQNVSPGSTFTANITVDPVDNEVFCVGYEISFDKDVVNVISQTEGDFLNHDGAETYVATNTYDNSIGKAEYEITRWGGVDYGITTPGTLASITFDVVGSPGEPGSLNFSYTMMGGNPIADSIDVVMYNATFAISTSYPRGDLDHDWVAADGDDVMLMLRASVGDGATNPEYDLNNNGVNADVGDVVLMLRVSVGDLTL